MPAAVASTPLAPPARATSPPSQQRRLKIRTPTHLNPSTHRSPSPPLSPPSSSPVASTIPPFDLPSRLPLSRESSARGSGPDIEAEDDTGTDSRVLDCSGQHPLQAEIERLTSLCEHHQLKYRRSKASFEHRVFTEFPSILGRFTELDGNAEKLTAELYHAMNIAVPRLHARLTTLLEERSADVEKMRERTTPWQEFMDEKSELGLMRVKSGQRVGRIDRIRQPDAETNEADALAMIERWADEVEMSLTADIARLKAQLGQENRRRRLIFQSGAYALSIAVLFVFLLIAFRKRLFSMFF